MLSHKHNWNSPIKENISPDVASNSPRKQVHTIKNLTQILKQHNIPIPQQIIQKNINNQKNNCQLKLKEINCDKSTQLKTLKVQLSDTTFELKKIEEDFAEYKVLARMQKQKLVKKYLSEIQQLKKKIYDDNSHWEKRFTKNCQQFRSQKQAYQLKLKSQFQDKIQTQTQSLQNKYFTQIHNLQFKVQDLSLYIKQQQQNYEAEKLNLIQFHQKKVKQQVQTLKVTSSQKQKEIVLKLQSKLQIVELERKSDSKKLQQSIQNLLNEKQNLQHNIYFLQKDNQQLKIELKSKQRKISQLQIAIRAKQNGFLEGRQGFEQQKIQIEQQNQNRIKQIKENHANEIKQIMSQHLNQLDSYYQRINSIEQLKISIETQYREEIRILQQKFSERTSKSEDLQEIQKLNTLIVIKDRQISRCQDQLKSSELIRQNNERNYNKIFNTHSSRRKSSNSHRDRQTFYKQSNTTDLKLLLKICNKEF